MAWMISDAYSRLRCTVTGSPAATCAFTRSNSSRFSRLRRTYSPGGIRSRSTPLPAVDLVGVLEAAAHVPAGGAPQPPPLVVGAGVPGRFLGTVRGGPGGEVAEPPVHVAAPPPAQLGVAIDGGIDERVE